MTIDGKRTYLGKKLIDDAVSNTGSTLSRPTLFTNRIQLIEDDDVQTTLVTLGFVL